MPDYEVTAPDGRTLTLTGDSPPTALELEHIFATTAPRPPVAPAEAEAEAPEQESALLRFWNELKAKGNPLAGLPSMARMATLGGNPLVGAAALVTGQPEAQQAKADIEAQLEAQLAVGRQARTAYQQGNLPEAAGRAVLAAAPFVGPVINEEAEAANQGDYAKAAGGTLGLAVQLGLGKAVERTGVPTVRHGLARDPVTRYAESIGARQNVGQATGSGFLSTVSHGAGYTPVGAIIEYLRAKKNRAVLAQAGGDVGQAVKPGPGMTPTEAGLDTEAALTARARTQGRIAGSNYGAVERAATDPRNARTVVPRRGAPPVSMAMPVDMRGIRTTLRPVWKQMQTFTDLTKQGIGDAIVSFRSLMEGDDFMPLMDAEKHLGALKKIMRESTGNERRLATQAVKELQRTIDQTTAQAGGNANVALKIGRAATRAKYKTQKLIEKTFGKDADFREQGNPVDRMLASGDHNIQMLRRVRAQAPQALPGIARAFVDKLVEQKGAKMLADWKRLGAAKKALLFTPAQIEWLDNLTELSARLANNPNPSGSGTTLIAAESAGLGVGKGLLGHFLQSLVGPATLHGGWISYLLQSPAAVKFATRATRLAMDPATSGQLSAARLAQISALLHSAQQAADKADDTDDEADGDQ
jgi:hypothetical protein